MTKAEILKYVFQFFTEYVMHSEDFQAWLKKIGVKAEDLTSSVTPMKNSRPRKPKWIQRRAASADCFGRLCRS